MLGIKGCGEHTQRIKKMWMFIHMQTIPDDFSSVLGLCLLTQVVKCRFVLVLFPLSLQISNFLCFLLATMYIFSCWQGVKLSPLKFGQEAFNSQSTQSKRKGRQYPKVASIEFSPLWSCLVLVYEIILKNLWSIAVLKKQLFQVLFGSIVLISAFKIFK